MSFEVTLVTHSICSGGIFLVCPLHNAIKLERIVVSDSSALEIKPAVVYAMLDTTVLLSRRAVICTTPPADNDRTEPKRYFGIHYGIREEESEDPLSVFVSVVSTSNLENKNRQELSRTSKKFNFLLKMQKCKLKV